MKRRVIGNQFHVLIVFFVVLLVLFLLRFPELGLDLWAVLQNLKITFLVLAIFVTLFHFFMEPFRWNFYLWNLSPPGIILYKKLLCIFSVTALVTYMFPVKLGLPVRFYLLTSELRLSLAKVSTFMAFDGMLAYSLWGMFALLFMPYHGVAMSQALVLILLVVLLVFLVAYLLRDRFRSHLKRVKDNIRLLTRRSIRFAVVILVADISGFIVRHALILEAVDVKLSLFKIAAITVISIFAGFISMLPMGMGAYDGVMILLLTQSGVAHETALIVPVLNRLGNILASILLGIPSSYILGVSFLSLRSKVETKNSILCEGDEKPS